MPSQFFKPASLSSRLCAIEPKKLQYAAEFASFLVTGSVNLFLSQRPRPQQPRPFDPPLVRRRRSF